MFKWYDKNEINTGRQREFDYLKGFFMVLIYMIHAFQCTLTPEDAVVRGVYIFNSMSGAAIFIFVMGFGSVYSKSASPAGFAKNGVRLLIYQYLNNLAYVAALLLPYPFIAASLGEKGKMTLDVLVPIYLQYTNIFFISGIIYLVLALLKKLKAAVWVYLAIGTAVSLAAPFVYGKEVDVPVLGYIVKLLIGEANYVSFTPLYFLPYALFGAAFAKLFRHVKDKKRFWLEAVPVCAVVAAVWWVIFIMQYGTDIADIRKAAGYGYINPDLWHAAASIAHVLLLAAIIFFINEKFGKNEKQPKNPVAKQILYYSTHISKFYALHPLTYLAALGFHGYSGFEAPWQVWLLTLLCMVTTECMVRGYNAVYDRVKAKLAAKKEKTNGT